MTAPEREVNDVVVALYRALGDRDAFDAHLHPDLTVWESDAEHLLRGLGALEELRDQRRARATAGPSPVRVAPETIVATLVGARGDVAVARYVLRATYADAPDEVFRVTDVLRRDERWRIVHHHAEKVA